MFAVTSEEAPASDKGEKIDSRILGQKKKAIKES